MESQNNLEPNLVVPNSPNAVSLRGSNVRRGLRHQCSPLAAAAAHGFFFEDGTSFGRKSCFRPGTAADGLSLFGVSKGNDIIERPPIL